MGKLADRTERKLLPRTCWATCVWPRSPNSAVAGAARVPFVATGASLRTRTSQAASMVPLGNAETPKTPTEAQSAENHSIER
eukprot:scaffold301_cov243-Pinguiococcus_pyrenoidosus.AAC.83